MSYIGIPPFGQTIRSVTNITATSSQTTFNIVGGYQTGYVDVFLNGVLLVPTTDYTATDGLTVVLGTGATAGDAFQALSYQPVSLVDCLQATNNLSDLTNVSTARTNLGLAIGTDVPAYSATTLKTSSTGSSILPSGTTAQRDGSPSAGYIRFNSDDGSFEGYDGSAWGSIGGGSNLTALGLWENAATITANYTITAGNNAMSAGPITVDSGVTVTVPSGSTWTVV